MDVDKGAFKNYVNEEGVWVPANRYKLQLLRVLNKNYPISLMVTHGYLGVGREPQNPNLRGWCLAIKF